MRNSNKLLALALAAVLAFGSTTAAFAAEADKDDSEATPISDTDTSKTPADTDEVEPEADVAGDEDEAAPADSEDKKDSDDESAAASGEDKKDDEAAATDAAPAMNYTDVTEKNWFHGAVSFVTEKKLMDGLTATTFGPSEDMTRQMLAVALYRLAGSPEVTAENPFTDVADNAAYKDAVVWAYSVGVVNGVTETTFSPDSSIQRQAIAAMLARYLKVDTSADGDLSAFKDADSIQNFAKGAMAWAAENELLKGNPDGTVNPRGNASRSAVATILQRFAPMAEGKAPAAGDAAPADDTNKVEDTTPVDVDDTNKDENTTPADDTSKDEDKTDDANKDDGAASADDTNKDDADTSADDANKDDATDKE